MKVGKVGIEELLRVGVKRINHTVTHNTVMHNKVQ